MRGWQENGGRNARRRRTCSTAGVKLGAPPLRESEDDASGCLGPLSMCSVGGMEVCLLIPSSSSVPPPPAVPPSRLPLPRLACSDETYFLLFYPSVSLAPTLLLLFLLFSSSSAFSASDELSWLFLQFLSAKTLLIKEAHIHQPVCQLLFHFIWLFFNCTCHNICLQHF